jgi:plasmid stabilization system protein ParE
MVGRPIADPREAGDAVTRTLRVRPEAEEELLAAAEFYEARKPGLGAELVAAVDEALERIADAPLASSVWRDGVPHRFHPLRRFPYLVFYVVDGAAVDVVAIAHGKRRPGFWRGR